MTLSLEARKALVATHSAGSLVRIEKFWRTGYSMGATRFRPRTIQALLAAGLMFRSGERLVRLTDQGRAEAEASIEILRQAAAEAIATRGFKARHGRKPPVAANLRHREPPPSFVRRLPYAD